MQLKTLFSMHWMFGHVPCLNLLEGSFHRGPHLSHCGLCVHVALVCRVLEVLHNLCVSRDDREREIEEWAAIGSCWAHLSDLEAEVRHKRGKPDNDSLEQ